MKRTKRPIVAACLAGLLSFAGAPVLRAQENPSLPEEGPAPANAPPQANPAPADRAAPAPAGRPDSEGRIRLNFRGVPLEMVLNHLSEAAGFVINLETEIQGDVNVWSNQPLTKDEAVDILNTILNQNGYAAIRQGRTLTIISRDDALKRNIPVKTGRDPQAISPSDEMVTQIIPIRYADAPQMIANLQPLLPTYANLSANESGNALVLTDTQSNIRRMVEIVQALDTAISEISVLRVFPLRHADSKELAEAVTKLFEVPQTGSNNRDRGGFRGFGGDRGDRGDRGNGASGDSEARSAASRVVAIADERSNSLIVGAPDEFMPSIERLVRDVDVQVDDITELRVFSLKNSDPTELAALFAELFPDESDSEENNGPRFRFGPPGFGGDSGRRGGSNNNSDSSDRMKKQGQVMAVADPRTSSLIVRAASELMPQIAQMIQQLDASPARKQKVFVYDLQNADVGEVEEILRGMFERGNTQANRTTTQEESALSNRRQNTQTTPLGGTGNTGLGNTGGLGGNSGRAIR